MKRKALGASMILAMIASVFLVAMPINIVVASYPSYYVYADFDSANTGGVYSPGQGCGGYRINETAGNLYVASGTQNGDVYLVTVPPGSDPGQHPLVDYDGDTFPDGLPMAPRTLTRIQRHDIRTDMGGINIYRSVSEFVITDSHIYYGPSPGGIHYWQKNPDGTFGTYQGKVVNVTLVAQTLAYDPTTNTFYAGLANRRIYSFTPGVDVAWQYRFTQVYLWGSHHDGLEWAAGYLWSSDMTSNYISEYFWNSSSVQWELKQIFQYTGLAVEDDVEGMGFGPFNHLWATGWNRLYELGGGELQEELIELDKALSDSEGGLGDVIHVTLRLNVPTGETATVVDTLPSEWRYINGTFTVDGVSATPTITKTGPPPPVIHEISYTFTDPGTYVIEFDCKVDMAYWEDREVCNVATATWFDEEGQEIETKEDVECFIIHAFEELHKNVGIPKADVVFAIDLTGSMADEIVEVKANATNIMNSLAAQIADVQFGLISFMDYDGYYTTYASGYWYNATYGSAASGDYPYKLDQDITNNIPVMTAKINGLTLGWGADGPQDYTRIIHEAYNDSNLHWRTDAKRILILFGDNVPHDTDFDNDNDGTADNTGGDPGRDTILGTADDLDFETEVANAAANGIHVMAVYSGWAGEKFPWTYMANETGGGYFELTEAEQIPDAIKDLIKSQAEETLTIKEKTEVQWAVVMDIINPFCYTMKNVTIKDNFGAELEIDQIMASPDTNVDGVVDVFDLAKVASNYGTMALVHQDQWDPVADINNDGVVDGRDLGVVTLNWGVTLWLTGKTDKVHLFWYIGDLAPGETARLILLVSTDLNPAGHQEYTEPGIYEMNSGATLKFIDPLQDMQLSAVTDSIYVTVLPLEDP